MTDFELIGSTHLVSTLVSHHDEQTPMIGSDAIVDERRDPWVQLLPHDRCLSLFG